MKIQSLEYENLLIAAVLLSKSDQDKAEVLCKVSPDKFHSKRTSSIWQAMVELESEKAIIDYVSVAERMTEGDNLTNMVDLSDITQDRLSADINIIGYSERVLSAAFVRDARTRVFDALSQLDSFEDITAVGEVPGIIDNIFQGLDLDTGKKGARSFKEIAEEYVESIEAKLRGDESALTVMTGMEDFDNMTGGFNKSDLVVVAAPPGMGKTAFVIKLMKSIAMTGGSTLMQQLEMGDVQVVERTIGAHGNISLGNLRSPKNLVESEYQRLSTAIGQLNETDIYIDDQAGLTVEEIVLRATKHCSKFDNTKAIIVDHLGIMKLPKADTRAIALGMVTARLKQLSKDLGVPVIILSQLNEKEINKRPICSRRPINSDIKDSSRVVEDADFIIFVYRHKVHDEKAPPIVELILGKARHSEQGAKCYMRFDNGNLLDIDQAMAFNQIDAYELSTRKQSNTTFSK